MNPKEYNQYVAIQEAPATSTEAMSSSIPSVNTEEAITHVPAQIRYKKTGCDAVKCLGNRTKLEGRNV